MTQAFPFHLVQNQLELLSMHDDGDTLASPCWVSKFVSSHLAHGTNIQHWNFCSLAQCPQCQASLTHIIWCPAPIASNLWQLSLKTLHQWLSDQQTSPELWDNLLHTLQAWYQEEQVPPQSPHQSQWYKDQQEIRWHSLLDGWLSSAWWYKQDQFWLQICSCKSSKKWMSELIKKLWDCVGFVGPMEQGTSHSLRKSHHHQKSSKWPDPLSMRREPHLYPGMPWECSMHLWPFNSSSP